MKSPRTKRKSESSDFFVKASKHWEQGELRSAFRLFLIAAKAGHVGAQLNVGCFYDEGIGVRRNRPSALYWYHRAYRHGDASAANNIATIWRDEHKEKRALMWFERAVKLGNEDSNLEVAKLCLRNKAKVGAATSRLKRVIQSRRVTEASIQEAKQLLESISQAKEQG